MNEDDSRTLVEIAKGNVDAYESIMDKYHKKLYGYILSLVRDPHTAEELTQQSFIKIYWNLDKFDKTREFSAWMYKIARNTVLDYLRKSNRHNALELDESIAVACEDEHLCNPADIVERQEKIAAVGDMIDALPAKYKELILLKYFEDLSYAEIAARLGMSQDKVKWSLHQARKKMVREFEKYDRNVEGRNAYEL